MFHVPEKYRLVTGRMGSNANFGNNGAFVIPSPISEGRKFVIIASDGMGWEHVSIHCERKNEQFTPYWDEMCFIKDLFWDDEDVVINCIPRNHSMLTIIQIPCTCGDRQPQKSQHHPAF